MLPRGRGHRSQFPSFYKGRGGRIPIIQHGNKKLFKENITGIDQLEDNPELFQKVQEYLNSKKDNEGTSSSWANKVQGSTSYAEAIASSEDREKYIPSPFKDIIVFLETHDLRWEKEPWKLMQRYMDTASYAAPSYKRRIFYEEFLTSMGACEIRHFKTFREAKSSTCLRFKFVASVSVNFNLLTVEVKICCRKNLKSMLRKLRPCPRELRTKINSFCMDSTSKPQLEMSTRVSRPGMFNMRDRAKWDAWKAVEGKSAEQAMNDYITKVKQLLEEAGSS
ncbi:hypothetical protein SASPL_140927 [Salvia splendens]|uniref:ACB domain-containing protein n=1 Tax=Salvia splendens TaxID=180675 RepID=A0A8X8ZC31_SALSN|nr:hypothetical protein SASPL_140927 [Salvia splendens]